MSSADLAASSPKTDAPLDIARVLLRGIGQVMFQGHAGTGTLFLIGIAVASPLMGVGAAIGAVVGPLVARLLKFDREEIVDGIYGFNATLVGIALVFYLRPVPWTWGLVLVGCAASSPVTYLMRRYLKFPTYTSPFIVVTWLLLILVHEIAGTTLDVPPAPPEHTPVGFLNEVFRGAAEVMFGANIVTGILFIVGIALSNWRHATLALLGSLIGTAVAVYHDDPIESISIGIYGYNAALAAIAIFIWRPSLLIPALAAVVSVPLTEFFPRMLGIPPLTAPFVAASWIILAVGVLESAFVKN
ncbi:urea transporter [Tautonia marina]|uniref:urea transporter n=1 Tax=Tautonia marina TaxID=2653855 RepID=UPI001260722F|nr:urea transporter [Tautonia marina]